MPSNTALIAKNTLALYFRQILIMLVSLYVVRVVLETLGAEDYGIYHLVAGIVTMFSFMSNSMASASQRYFSFELGRNDLDQLQKVFSLMLLVFILITVIFLLLSETLGLWFVSNKLVIPPERRTAALWVYQFAIASFSLGLLTSPYMAMIIAHEDMNIYAYMGIVDALLKLGIVFVLRFISWDKLAFYGFLILSVNVISTAIYMAICLYRYKQCKFSFFWNNNLFKEIVGYLGWIMFGVSTEIFKKQVVNIMLNQFVNPVVVAARSIAVAVDNAAMSFSLNFNTAMRPQIIKSYAANQKETMLTYLFNSSKGSYLLMYLIALPLLLEMPMILGIWLKNPPEYSVLFTRLMLFDILIESITFPIMTAAHATGKITLYQSVIGGIVLLNVPGAWFFLYMGAPPYSVLFVAIVLTVIGCMVQLLLLKRLISYSIRKFARIVILPVCAITIISAVLPTLLCFAWVQNMARLCLVIGLSVISVCVSSYFIGLNKDERQKARNIISGYIKKLHFKKTN